MSRREIRTKFDEIVNFAEIENFLDTPVKRYSSGMYVRLAFAVAAHLEPEILIVDEVLAVGDFAFQKKCLGKMQEVAGAGRTVLFVSHNMSSVVQLCKRALLFKRGSLALDGPAEDVVQAYITDGQSAQDDILDFADMRREPNTNGRARFVSARLNSEDRVGPWAAPFGTTLSLEVRIDVLRPLQRLEFGLALCDATGDEFATSMSHDALPLSAIESGEYVLEVALPSLRLSTGSYYLNLGLLSDRGMEDHLVQAIRLEVLPNAESAAALIHLRRGHVIPELSFLIHRLTHQELMTSTVL
jgi:lipopolysaccharide transport system ATP-binding protein